MKAMFEGVERVEEVEGVEGCEMIYKRQTTQ
jgi:hypothetical protein